MNHSFARYDIHQRIAVASVSARRFGESFFKWIFILLRSSSHFWFRQQGCIEKKALSF